jgi:glycosyltransferase involved in cell wall biosynthesis
MKVLFIFGGMPHYLVALLNKLHGKFEIDVTAIIPAKKFSTIGKAVKQSQEGINFEIIKVKEYLTVLRKPYFKGLSNVLQETSPDLIVIGWPYILNLIFDLKSLSLIKEKKIGLILREIPLNVAPNGNYFKYYRENPVYDEDLRITNPKGILFYPWAFFLKLIRKKYYSILDATMAYADIAYSVHQSYGIEKDRIFVTGNSPDTEILFKAKQQLEKLPALLPGNPFRIIHIGRLVKWKRIDLILSAIASLRKKYPEIELVIIGNGPEENRLQQIIQNLELEAVVKFAGAIYDPLLLGQYLKSSSIYVLAGMGGLSINEAMAFGKPVICSVCDGTEKSLVFDGYNGLYFQAGNVESLIEKIDLLFSDPALVSQMGENSENIIREKVNLDTVAQKMFNAFTFVSNQKIE